MKKLNRIIRIILIFFGIKKSVARKAYKLLKGIPYSNWTTAHNEQSKSCILGHYFMLTKHNNKAVGIYDTDLALEGMRFLKEIHDFYGPLWYVNDGYYVNGYNQDHPKDRSMAVLKDMIKWGY